MTNSITIKTNGIITRGQDDWENRISDTFLFDGCGRSAAEIFQSVDNKAHFGGDLRDNDGDRYRYQDIPAVCHIYESRFYSKLRVDVLWLNLATHMVHHRRLRKPADQNQGV